MNRLSLSLLIVLTCTASVSTNTAPWHQSFGNSCKSVCGAFFSSIKDLRTLWQGPEYDTEAIQAENAKYADNQVKEGFFGVFFPTRHEYIADEQFAREIGTYQDEKRGRLCDSNMKEIDSKLFLSNKVGPDDLKQRLSDWVQKKTKEEVAQLDKSIASRSWTAQVWAKLPILRAWITGNDVVDSIRRTTVVGRALAVASAATAVVGSLYLIKKLFASSKSEQEDKKAAVKVA